MSPLTVSTIEAAAEQAAAALGIVNDLINPLQGRSGLTSVTQVTAVVGALTRIAEDLPPVLEQLGRWLESEAVAGRLLLGGAPLAGATAGLTVGEDLEEALAGAETAGQFLKEAHHTLTSITSAPAADEH